MIHIDMTRQDTRHPDKRCRHSGRAWCDVGNQRFETQGPAPIYKLVTLLWLHAHGGVDFEVRDDLSPFGKPGGLAMRGRVRNWARIVKGKPRFDRKALHDTAFTSAERDAVAKAAGRVTADTPHSAPSSGDRVRTVPISLRDDPAPDDVAPVIAVTAASKEAA